MLSAGFEPAIPANERPQTHALHRATTWIGTQFTYTDKWNCCYYTEHKRVRIPDTLANSNV